MSFKPPRDLEKENFGARRSRTRKLHREKNRLNIVEQAKTGGGRRTNFVNSRNKEHRLDDAAISCPGYGNPREIIGFDTSRQIEFDKLLFEYINHILFKYKCKGCDGPIIRAQKPYQPIDKGSAGPGLLAKITTDKFWLHLPLYRQEQVFQALNIPINRASMSRWIKGIAELFAPIVYRMKSLILKSEVIQYPVAVEFPMGVIKSLF